MKKNAPAAPPPPLNLDAQCDYACFAIWEHGRTREAEIIKDIESSFDVLGKFIIHWSDKNYNRNTARLYEGADGQKGFTGYSKKIGKPPFSFIIVRDKNPQHTYMKSVSGAIELSNKGVVQKKYDYRSLFEKPYQIHSSNSLYEFLFQSVLVLGMDALQKTLNGENAGQTIDLHKDLEGSDGWKDWDEVFSILNLCANYLVLRNYETLPARLDGEGIDFLCDDYQHLASAANIYQNDKKPYTGKMTVAGKEVAANIRFTGDGYYPTSWAKDFLGRRTFSGHFYTPVQEDLFFTLLYHAKVHKSAADLKDIGILETISAALNFDWFDSKKLHDDTEMGKNLAGYMQASKYFYEKPLDKEAGENQSIIKHLPVRENIGKRKSGGRLRKLFRFKRKKLKI